jgi:hypothetical protein
MATDFGQVRLPPLNGAAELHGGRFGRVGLRLWTALHRAGLDRRLAAGEDPCASPSLALRAARLTGGRSRRRLAEALEDAVEDAMSPQPHFSAAVPTDRAAVYEAAPQIAEIEEILRLPGPVYAQGVAMTKLLLTDSASPLYPPARPGALATSLEWIIRALEGQRAAGSPWK